jgi:hypothetical protein
MQRLAKPNAAQADKVHDLLRYLYPGFSEDLSNYPNVEDFLNLVEMAKEFHGEAYIESKRWSQTKLQEAADISLRAITEYIWEFMADDDRRRVLSGLVGELVRPGDVIVSFNWDLMIDLALEDLDENGFPVYSYSSSRDSVILLKPHGSIDWFEKSKLPGDKKLQKEMLHRATGVCFYPYFQLAQNPATVPTRPSRSRRPPVLDHLITCHFASVRNVNLNEALDDHLLAAHGERAFGEADGDDHGPAACAIAAYGITR